MKTGVQPQQAETLQISGCGMCTTAPGGRLRDPLGPEPVGLFLGVVNPLAHSADTPREASASNVSKTDRTFLPWSLTIHWVTDT